MASYTPWSFALELWHETASAIEAHKEPLVAYTLLWFGLHALVQYVIPLLSPGAYDFILAGDGPLSARRATAAADIRTKVVATAMAVYVCAASVYGLTLPELHSLRNPYGSTPLTQHLALLTAGYFVWDVVMCVFDRLQIGFWVHGWACLLAFIWALRPFQHYMAFIVLLFEVSTIFMHWRKLLIQMRRTHGWVFQAVQYSFAATFFFFRLVIGGYQFWHQVRRIRELIKSGEAPNVAVCYMFLVFCVLLFGLNCWWMSQIILAATSGGGAKRKAGAPDAALASPWMQAFTTEQGFEPGSSPVKKTMRASNEKAE